MTATAPAPIPGAEPASRKTLLIVYTLSLLGGLGGAAYVFLYQHMSESQLVQAAWMWTLPVVFGAYGLLAERGLSRVRRGQSRTLGVAVLAMSRLFGLLGMLVLLILMLPLLLLSKLKHSLPIAIFGAGFWAGLLWFFFEAVFPSL